MPSYFLILPPRLPRPSELIPVSPPHAGERPRWCGVGGRWDVRYQRWAPCKLSRTKTTHHQLPAPCPASLLRRGMDGMDIPPSALPTVSLPTFHALEAWAATVARESVAFAPGVDEEVDAWRMDWRVRRVERRRANMVELRWMRRRRTRRESREDS
jgi:hypothetical protein